MHIFRLKSLTFVQILCPNARPMDSCMKFFILTALTTLCISCSRGEYIVVRGFAQGGEYSVKLDLEGVTADRSEIASSIDSILLSIDRSLSGYNRSSLLSRFNGGESIIPDEPFLDIYERAYDFYESTGGAVDVAAGPLFDIWGFGFRESALPSAEVVESTLEKCGMHRLRRDIRALTGEDGLLRPADLIKDGHGGDLPVLNYNAIAQGYSCDLIAGYLHSVGVKNMLVDIGEIYCEGLNPSGKPWSIGIDRPEDGNETPGAKLDGIWHSGGGAYGVVTSGNYRKFYIRDGKKYSHTIDPRSGFPAEQDLLSATIVSASPDHPATEADALATYCMVVGFEKARDFILSSPQIEGCLITGSRIWTSPGF